MSKSLIDSLIYIDDYIDIVEALQIDLQKNFTLLKEMDGYAQDSTCSTAKAAIDLIDNIDNLSANDRFTQLKQLVQLLEETVQRSSEKAALAKVTLDAVDRHCNRLDADLVKFEENHPIGSIRIASLPGLIPSSRSLREYSRMSLGEKITKKMSDKQSIKKRRIGKEDFNRALKETPRSRNTQTEKNTKPKALPSRKNNSKLKTSDMDMSIDPNEPVYCYCQGVSYGEMVACDNADCDIEWFHIACVDLKAAPKGKWFCDNCSKYKGKNRR
ncbi:hypothetical protein EDC96DRAFT_505961 [Choanephora cucurbitarum]|uniref:Chromatin modification-related protein n=1 Tax=Choanephora cucurbitarum TaxID=101091 RepID=A0A1C7MZD5_9FUNG|nr:hypothetical protein EDC96DRAFT_505961 [Choanephora cucurbitarum]OBZ82183.1 Inhibitor of growth protein 4 [Choanephora cucurbitarum]